MSAPTIGVVAVQGDVREHVAMLQACGALPLLVRRPSELACVDGIVLPGGESTTIDKLLRAFDLFDPLRDRIRAGMPTYGTCAGMILLADRITDAAAGQQTLGGITMTVRRNAFGRQVDSFETVIDIDTIALGSRRPSGLAGHSDVAGGGQPAEVAEGLRRKVAFIRAPLVESLGAQAQVVSRLLTASSGMEAKPLIVAVRQGNLLATAFHPEITGCLDFHQRLVALASAKVC